MVKQFFMLSAKRFVVCLLISVPFLADISAQDYQPTRQNAYPSRYRQNSTQNQRTQNAYPSRYRQSSTQNQRTQNAYPSRYRQSSTQNQRTQDTFFSRFRQNSSQYQRNGSTRREYSNPFMKQDQNNNSSKTEKSSKRSANSGEESRQLSPSVSDNTLGDVELVVTGDGPTKEKATLSALCSALEQVYGTMVSSNTKILNDELVKDEIVSISTGIVKKYTYLSEKEVGGRFYVVVKALVTPQKLITYAKQKGASTELAGATFAANVRIQKLNEENERIAIRNITEMQLKLLANSFDCVITDMKEPEGTFYERQFGFGSDVYGVKFNICLKFNDNAKHIQELQHEKEAIGRIDSYYCRDEVLNILFDRIMVYDDIGTYNLKIVEKEKGYYYIEQGGTQYQYYANGGLYVTRESSLARPALQYGGGGYLGEFMVPYENTMTKFTVYNYKFVEKGNVNWHLVKPNEIFVEIPVEMVYDLSDLEKITGIHVALKDLSEESTSHNPSKNVPQSLAQYGFTDNIWEIQLSMGEKEFLKNLEHMKSEETPPGISKDYIEQLTNTMKEEWYKAKGMK